MDLTDRKKQILKVVVEDYIRTAEPVGSKAIAAEMGGSVSSATIRNELSDLVELGYLEQPHTSAGRVPAPLAARRSSRRSCPAPSRKRPKAASALRSLRSPLAGCGISTGISSSSSRRSPI